MSKRLKNSINSQVLQTSKIQRDVNIFKCAQGELNLGTRSVRDKSKYSRKEKYRKSFLD